MNTDTAGKTISPTERSAADTLISVWARSQEGAYSCCSAVDRESLRPRERRQAKRILNLEVSSHVFKRCGEERFQTLESNVGWCIVSIVSDTWIARCILMKLN